MITLGAVARVLAVAAAFDRRDVSDEDVMVWQAAFTAGGLDADSENDARAAVIEHYARTRQWVMPSDVIEHCKQARRARLEAAGDLYRLVQLDPDDPGYHAEYLRIRSAVAAGTVTPLELEAGR